MPGSGTASSRPRRRWLAARSERLDNREGASTLDAVGDEERDADVAGEQRIAPGPATLDLAEGMDGVVEKPIKADLLAAAIEAAVASREDKRAAA